MKPVYSFNLFQLSCAATVILFYDLPSYDILQISYWDWLPQLIVTSCFVEAFKAATVTVKCSQVKQLRVPWHVTQNIIDTYEYFYFHQILTAFNKLQIMYILQISYWDWLPQLIVTSCFVEAFKAAVSSIKY
jgi:hypothetical protein